METKYQESLYCPECHSETLTKFGRASWAKNEEGIREKKQRYLCGNCGRTTKKPVGKEEK